MEVFTLEQYPKTYIKLLQHIKKLDKTVAQGEMIRLQPESDLAKEIGVSRAKIRDILAQLETSGYITRKRGCGTLINRLMLHEKARLDIDTIYMDMIQEYGMNAHTNLLSMNTVYSPSPTVLESLRLAPHRGVYHISNTICANEKPLVLIHNFIPISLYDKVENNFILWEKNIFYFLQQMSEEPLENMTVHMDAVVADEELAKLMQVDIGFPLLRLESVCYTKGSSPVLYSVEHFNTKIVPLSFQKRILSSKFKISSPIE